MLFMIMKIALNACNRFIVEEVIPAVCGRFVVTAVTGSHLRVLEPPRSTNFQVQDWLATTPGKPRYHTG